MLKSSASILKHTAEALELPNILWKARNWLVGIQVSNNGPSSLRVLVFVLCEFVVRTILVSWHSIRGLWYLHGLVVEKILVPCVRQSADMSELMLNMLYVLLNVSKAAGDVVEGLDDDIVRLDIWFVGDVRSKPGEEENDILMMVDRVRI